MVDFNSAIEVFNNYKGSEKKKTLIYNKKRYLVKFPDPIIRENTNLSFKNNAFSEYVGSNVFQLSGFNTQNTILGKYTYNGKEKIVCACEDFTGDDNILYEFESLALSTNPDKKIETELIDIMEVIEESKMINSKETKDKFWDMFVIDSIIGNTDRHNGNWGFILNKKTNQVTFAPIYDCGSCLNPIYEDSQIENLTEQELKNLAINCYSCIKVNGKKINYMSYINQMKDEMCNEAIKRVFEDIKIDKILAFIDEIDAISMVRKEFYKRLIKYRYDIIKKVYDKI